MIIHKKCDIFESGGGDWEVVRGMIEEAFQDCMVFICECDKG